MTGMPLAPVRITDIRNLQNVIRTSINFIFFLNFVAAMEKRIEKNKKECLNVNF